MSPAEQQLDKALCNFCNNADDPIPDVHLWSESVRRDFAELCVAYNAWAEWVLDAREAPWRPMSERPSEPVQAEIYYGKSVFRDWKGDPVEEELPPYRDERREHAFWDGKDWCHNGTAHLIYEDPNAHEEELPTHWRPCCAPPGPRS